MQIQIGCTVKPNCNMAKHTGVCIARISPSAHLCHADHNGQSFVLFFFFIQKYQCLLY